MKDAICKIIFSICCCGSFVKDDIELCRIIKEDASPRDHAFHRFLQSSLEGIVQITLLAFLISQPPLAAACSPRAFLSSQIVISIVFSLFDDNIKLKSKKVFTNRETRTNILVY